MICATSCSGTRGSAATFICLFFFLLTKDKVVFGFQLANEVKRELGLLSSKKEEGRRGIGGHLAAEERL